jgi:hypothetical protein
MRYDMKNICLIISVILFHLSTNTFAGWVDMQGNSLPDTASLKSIGDFGVNLILTDKEEEFFKRWNTPSRVVQFTSTNKIKRGEFITALIVFIGCGVDKSGNCNLLVKFTINQPNGSVYGELPLQEVWVDKPAPPNNSLGLSIAYLKIRIEPNEPLGKYKVFADIIDRNLGKTLHLTQSFDAIE